MECSSLRLLCGVFLSPFLDMRRVKLMPVTPAQVFPFLGMRRAKLMPATPAQVSPLLIRAGWARGIPDAHHNARVVIDPLPFWDVRRVKLKATLYHQSSKLAEARRERHRWLSPRRKPPPRHHPSRCGGSWPACGRLAGACE